MMAADDASATKSSLILRVRDTSDQQAWGAFVDRYGPKIYAWCLKWKLQEVDAEEVTQDLLSKLVQVMRSFKYDRARGSFRGWLHTVARNAWQDYLKKRKETVGLDPAVWDELRGGDLSNELESLFDREVWEEAAARTQLQVSARDWQIFQLLELEERPGAEVAAQFQIKVANVYMVKKRVLDKLKQEIQNLDRDDLD